MLKIRSRLIPKGGNNPDKRIEPDTIVIHYTAVRWCTADTLATCFVNDRGGYHQSCNYAVDNHEVICLIPSRKMSYGVSGHNDHVINIEVCYTDEEGRFELATIENLRELVRRLMVRHKIPAEMVKRHYDMTGKMCPWYYAKHEDEWEVLHKLITTGRL